MNYNYIFIFIYLLSNYLTLIEYVQRRGNQIIPKSLLYKHMYLFILLLLFFSYINFRVLQYLSSSYKV
jgi:hypothetical protein